MCPRGARNHIILTAIRPFLVFLSRCFLLLSCWFVFRDLILGLALYANNTAFVRDFSYWLNLCLIQHLCWPFRALDTIRVRPRSFLRNICFANRFELLSALRLYMAHIVVQLFNWHKLVSIDIFNPEEDDWRLHAGIRPDSLYANAFVSLSL